MGLLTTRDKAVLRVGTVQYYTTAFKVLAISERQNVSNGELVNFCFNIYWHSPETLPPYLIRFNWVTSLQETQAADGSLKLHVYAPVLSTKYKPGMIHTFLRERGVSAQIGVFGVTRMYRL